MHGTAAKAKQAKAAAGVEPASAFSARGLRILKPFRNAYLRINRLSDDFLPDAWNPLAQIGALANLNFLIALATGILLLIWYKPSVHSAYASLQAMQGARFGAGLVQSLHRYSSDACMLLLLVHGLEAVLSRRFQRPRALAWITGLVLCGVVWGEGWLGYWLVWDDRAQAIATLTGRAIDLLPVFEEPLSRSFLEQESLSSLFFFVIFFVHMLIPLGFALGLWLHVTRVNRPRFLASRQTALAMLGALALLSLAWPARAGEAADLGRLGAALKLDLFYMLPLLPAIAARPWPWALAAAIFTGLALLVPFLLGRYRVRKPVVVESKCIGCNRCFEDCPFNAISMVPDAEGKPKAVIDPDACLACGNCVGACNPKAVDFGGLPLESIEAKVRAWFDGGDLDHLAFLCANSAASGMTPDPVTGMVPQLPGYRCVSVPCTGWILPRLLEVAAQAGCRGTLIAGCGPGTPTHRLGAEWTFARLLGRRLPALSAKRVEGMDLEYAMYNRPETASLTSQARVFLDRAGRAPGPGKRPLAAPITWAAAFVSFALIALLSALPSRVPVGATAAAGECRLAISLLRAPGQVREVRRSEAENEKLLPHMRGAQEMARERRGLVLEVRLDGRLGLRKYFRPRGLFRDGAAAGIEHLGVAPGSHQIEIALREGGEHDEEGGEGGGGDLEKEPGGIVARESRMLEFIPGRMQVVVIEGKGGFRWP